MARCCDERQAKACQTPSNSSRANSLRSAEGSGAGKLSRLLGFLFLFFQSNQFFPKRSPAVFSVIPHQVHRDPQQPCFDPALPTKSASLHIRTQEALLGEGVGYIPVAHEQENDSINTPLMPTHDSSNLSAEISSAFSVKRALKDVVRIVSTRCFSFY